MHLEDNFGHGSRYLSEAFFVPNVLAFFMHQIFSLVDELYQRARATFSSRREYWNAIRSALRRVLFDSKNHLLQRIHGLPLPERRIQRTISRGRAIHRALLGNSVP